MSEFDDDTLEDQSYPIKGERRQPRPLETSKLVQRFYDRATLLRRWMTRVVFPKYWKPILASMTLRTGGTLAEAASFVIAAQLLVYWTSIEGQLPDSLANPLVVGGGLLFLFLVVGALCGYAGERLSIRTAVNFETYAFARAVTIVRDAQNTGRSFSKLECRDLFISAPRFMGRTILQCIGVGTSLVLIVVGGIICAITFPILSGVLALFIVAMAPIYIYHSLHSTSVGHRFRDASPAFSGAKKDLYRDWLTRKEADENEFIREANSRDEYTEFLRAYSDRLGIAPVSHLTVNGGLAISILASLLWVGSSMEMNSETVLRLVTYLVFVRVFFSGVRGVMSAIQVTASFVPNYLLYLKIDPLIDGR